MYEGSPQQRWYNNHKKKANKIGKAWRDKNPNYMKERGKYWVKKLKETVIGHYGGKCTCCGETLIEFLTMDHINGGGNKHRKEIGQSNLYRWLIKNHFPEGFQVLCYNCNSSLGHCGYCPHEIIRKKNDAMSPKTNP